MRLLVNTLSIGSMSGQHVVYGFLLPFLQWMRGGHEMVILHYECERPPQSILDAGAKTVCLPDRLRHWAKRTVWEAFRLASVVHETHSDLVLTVSGALSPNCPVPQIVLCQNPWCYRTDAHYSVADRIKAALQRHGYKRAYRDAAMMVYISHHLRGLYAAANPGIIEKKSAVAYVGLNEETFQAAATLRGSSREPLSILSVSAMARWKGAETLVDAVRILHERGLKATLKLVGPWPEADYESEVRGQIQRSGLKSHVTITGKVTDDELHRLYAASRVFCLMSSCESFGIPAAEAMCFGTPVVSTNCCAISEICAQAGLFGPVGDPEWTATALESVLVNESRWSVWSASARQHASGLTWNQCAVPFRQIPELVSP